MTIIDRVKQYLINIPNNVVLVAAAKTRTLEEVQTAISAGIQHIGENYLQEGEKIIPQLKNQVKWHFIGKLQKNKAKKAVQLFDVIETVDSCKLAKEINKRAEQINKIQEIFIEINIAGEKEKSGITPDSVAELMECVQNLQNINLTGFMTMGPPVSEPEQLRPYFKKAFAIFSEYKTEKLRFLSMGMTDSYKVAIEEGANIVRIGTGLFGPRNYNNP